MKALLVTLHAKYSHSSLALPCLAAACKEINGLECSIREYTINDPIDRTLSSIVGEEADVIAFSCYIWNINHILRLVADLKLLFPHTTIILGGPEASCGSFELMEKNPAIDIIIRDEGEVTFHDLMESLVETGNGPSEAISTIEGTVVRSGSDTISTPKRSPVSDLDTIPSPFALGLVDLSKPLVYYETSRGCPFSCAFCMSSLENGVRSFSMQRIMADLSLLMAAGARTVKLVDRTFNYDAGRANAIWRYILEHNRKSRFHFEIAADLLTEENLTVLEQVPPDTFRFEIGVQSESRQTLAQVNRHTDLELLGDRVRNLRERTGVTLHLDLVAGLPQEDFEGFLSSAGHLLELSPHHIQVEPLKVLKGTPMRKIAEEENYLFSPNPPYKILRTPWLSFQDIGRIESFSRFIDLIYNSGRFSTFLGMVKRNIPQERFFADLVEFSNRRVRQETLHDVFSLIRDFCIEPLSEMGDEEYREALAFDLCLWDYPGRTLELFRSEAILPSLPKQALHDLLRSENRETGRIRTFAARFQRDYRSTPFTDSPADLIFIYRSGAGGQTVSVAEYRTPDKE